MAEPPPDHVVAQAVARAANPGFGRWIELVHAAGCCSQPVRLTGKVFRVDSGTGEARLAYSTVGEPEGVLFKACESRRATRCPACAAVYQGDARALVLAGLTGGKGVPQSVADNPQVFVTLTAPSFGPVHRSGPETCRPRRSGRCSHGNPSWCGEVHTAEDPRLGEPLCPDCYDYPGAVIFNACASQLWSRTTIALRRTIAAKFDVSRSVFDHDHLVSFIKVVEYQQRGVVHLHGLLRLDRWDDHTPKLTPTLLLQAAQHAAVTVHSPNPLPAAPPCRWGKQVAVSVVTVEERRRAANYLAKYATKSTDEAGALDRRLRHGDTGHLAIPDHLRRMVETAWQLGGQPALVQLNLRHWAHALGYRGHWLTKSRHWSTTFGALRDARHAWRLTEASARGRQTPAEEDAEPIEVPEWSYLGMGYANPGEAWLAESAGRAKRLNRRTAWEER